MASRKLPFVRFCVEVLHLTLTAQWRVLLLVAIDGLDPCALDDSDREIARLLFGDVDMISHDVRRIMVWRLGRGSGKSTLAAALALWAMWTGDLSTCGVGTLPAAVVVSPSKATAKIAVRIGRELVRQSNLEKYVVKRSDSEEGFQLRRATDGRIVEFKCCAASRGGATLRGFDVIAIIFDESEFFESNSDSASPDGFAVSDRDLLSAAMPRLLGFALFISTPWPTENLTAELFDRNHGRPQDALAALGPSTFMRPDDRRLARDVVRERIRDSENAAREYDCDPGVRGGRRIFVEGLDEAIDRNRPLVIRAVPGALVGCGGDLGLERDSSAIAFASLLKGTYDLLEFDEIRPAKGKPLSPGYVIRDRFAPLMRTHGTKSIMADAHYRQSAIEHLEAEKLAFLDAPTGQQGKYDVHMHFRAQLRAGTLKLPNAPKLLAQLRSVTATPVAGGGTKISSPRRSGQGHGDVVSAAVLAVWSAGRSRPAVPLPRALFHQRIPDDFWTRPRGDPTGSFGI